MISKFTNGKDILVASDESVREYALKDRKYKFVIRICWFIFSLTVITLTLVFHKDIPLTDLVAALMKKF